MNFEIEFCNFLVNFLTQPQISSLSLGLLLTSLSEQILVNQRMNIALKVDLLLDFIHSFVKFLQIYVHTKNSLLE